MVEMNVIHVLLLSRHFSAGGAKITKNVPKQENIKQK
jgi:hypothetical protein